MEKVKHVGDRIAVIKAHCYVMLQCGSCLLNTNIKVRPIVVVNVRFVIVVHIMVLSKTV